MSKTILITGTSSGLGKSTAKYFAAMGWNVAATMRSPQKEMELTRLDNVRTIKMDVTDAESVNEAINEAVSIFGKIDVVVNNAGIGRYGALELVTNEDIDSQWNTNVKGVINVVRGIMPHFRANNNGMIINIGSIMGLSSGMPLASLYNMSKFALEGLTEALYYELKPLNVELRIVEPGGFKSEFNNDVRLNRIENITGYEALTDKIEYILNHLDDSPTGDIMDIVRVIFALATHQNNNFRTIVGADSLSLLEARKAVDIESFLEATLNNFN